MGLDKRKRTKETISKECRINEGLLPPPSLSIRIYIFPGHPRLACLRDNERNNAYPPITPATDALGAPFINRVPIVTHGITTREKLFPDRGKAVPIWSESPVFSALRSCRGRDDACFLQLEQPEEKFAVGLSRDPWIPSFLPFPSFRASAGTSPLHGGEKLSRRAESYDSVYSRLVAVIADFIRRPLIGFKLPGRSTASVHAGTR